MRLFPFKSPHCDWLYVPHFWIYVFLVQSQKHALEFALSDFHVFSAVHALSYVYIGLRISLIVIELSGS